MPSFSERHGYVKARDAFQIESADAALRSTVWNVVAASYIPEDAQFVSDRDSFKAFCVSLSHHFFRRPVDEIRIFVSDERKFLKEVVLSCKWHQLYDLIEFLSHPKVTAYLQKGSRDNFIARMNEALKASHAGYRLVDGIVVPITDELELKAIDGALALPDKYAPARKHIQAALELFADRTSPDYRNAIKEAISAVESISRLVTGERKAGSALDELVASFSLHPAMTNALKQIYGYTNDGDGIRHSLLKDSDADAPLAKFMIVACSAFLSYAVEKIAATTSSPSSRSG